VNCPDGRDAQRRELMQLRITLTDRDALEQALADRVDAWLVSADVRAVGFFWPIRGEPDLRSQIGAWLAHDERRRAALPVITGATLEFHQWAPQAPMRAGQHGIPVPAQGRVVQPDCLLIPCLGFDATVIGSVTAAVTTTAPWRRWCPGRSRWASPSKPRASPRSTRGRTISGSMSC
jgi:5-formyltetrahydrofolate cyclo-ligase